MDTSRVGGGIGGEAIVADGAELGGGGDGGGRGRLGGRGEGEGEGEMEAAGRRGRGVGRSGLGVPLGGEDGGETAHRQADMRGKEWSGGTRAKRLRDTDQPARKGRPRHKIGAASRARAASRTPPPIMMSSHAVDLPFA